MAATWDLDLEQPRLDVTQMGSPSVQFIPTGLTTGNLRFTLADQSDSRYIVTTDGCLELLQRYLHLIGVNPDE